MNRSWYYHSKAVCLKVSGRDARRYLNNRLSNDLRSVVPGRSLMAAALNAQGRVEGLFTVLCDAEDSFLLVGDGGEREVVRASVGRFIVADRVVVEDLTDNAVWLHVATTEDAFRAELGELAGMNLHVRAHPRIEVNGIDCLVLGGKPPHVLSRCAEVFGPVLSRGDYDLARCKYGTAVFPDEVNEGVILTECGMREAVSFSKGCYVGQEVIERSDAIGKLPRALERVRLDGTDAVAAGGVVANTLGESIGKIINTFPDIVVGITYAFALLRRGAYSTDDAVVIEGRRGNILTAHP